jgi:F-type H+-transporting ATPase subunit c
MHLCDCWHTFYVCLRYPNGLWNTVEGDLKPINFKDLNMKKFFLLFLALGAVAFADGDGESMIKAYSVVAAGVGLGLAALGGAIGMGNTAAATIAGTARNPALGGKLMTTMFIALAMIEAQVIYTLVIALIALYANPFL